MGPKFWGKNSQSTTKVTLTSHQKFYKIYKRTQIHCTKPVLPAVSLPVSLTVLSPVLLDVSLVPCLASCLTCSLSCPCLAPCLAPCLTPCLAPCLTRNLGVSVPTKILQFKVPTTMRKHGVRQVQDKQGARQGVRQGARQG